MIFVRSLIVGRKVKYVARGVIETVENNESMEEFATRVNKQIKLRLTDEETNNIISIQFVDNERTCIVMFKSTNASAGNEPIIVAATIEGHPLNGKA